MIRARFLLNFVFAFVLFTALGQIRWEDRSLEHRYHSFVNSEKFQAWFWAMAIPVTWTGEQIGDGYATAKRKFTKETTKESAR